jgi:argininosuccinate synthase
MLMHEGLYFDPVMRDLEALLGSANRLVSGEARVRLFRGSHDVVGVRSPFSLLDPAVAVYGEGASAWTGEQAAGFARIHGLPSLLAARRDALAAERAASSGAGPRPVPPPSSARPVTEGAGT